MDYGALVPRSQFNTEDEPMKITSIETVDAGSIPARATRGKNSELVNEIVAKALALPIGKALRVELEGAERWRGYVLGKRIQKANPRVATQQRGSTLFVTLVPSNTVEQYT